VLAGTAATTPTPSRTEGDSDLGLELLWLPVESRTRIDDYAGRNLPGATLDPQGRLLLRGGGPADTAYEVDGYRLAGPPSLPIGLVERFDVATAGFGATWADVLGGVVGVTAASGSNRGRTSEDLHIEARDDRATAVLSATASGPALRDRLFFALSFQAQASVDPAVKDVQGILPDGQPYQTRRSLLGLKLTWLPAPGHRVESLTFVDLFGAENSKRLGVAEEAQPAYDDRDLFTGVRWSHRFGPFTRVTQVGFQRVTSEEMPRDCRENPDTCDSEVPRVFTFPVTQQTGNWIRHSHARESRWQLSNTLAWRQHGGSSFRHALRLTSRVMASERSWAERTPGDTLFETGASGSPEARTQYYSNDPRYEPARFGWYQARGSSLTTVNALESELGFFDRLFLSPGVALTAGRARNEWLDVDQVAVTPHLRVAWDASGDGRTWLRGAWHERTAGDLDRLVQFARADRYSQRCSWDAERQDYSRNCVFSGGIGRTVGLPCGPDDLAPDGTSCRQVLQPPRSRELWGGVERALTSRFRVGLDVIHRRSVGLPQTEETNRNWNAAGTAVSGFRTGRAQSVYDYSTLSAATSRYLGVTASARQELGALRFLLSYTWSKHETNLGAAPLPGQYFLHPTSGDRRHVFRAQASYDIYGYVSIGALYAHESGIPNQRLYRNAGFDPYEQYRSRVGVNPGANINDPGDDRPSHGPDLTRLNLQLKVRLKQIVGLDFEGYADFINVLSSGQLLVTEMGTGYVAEPGWLRIGLGFRH
jgi:hypothetical protein